MKLLSHFWISLVVSAFIGLSISCNTDVTEVYNGTTQLYATSFEAPTDTVGWSYVWPFGRRYEEGAPGKGQYSFQVVGSSSSSQATYTLPWVDEGTTVLVNFHAKGVGMLRVRVMNHLPMAEQFIVDTTWTEYSVSGVFSTGGDLKVELFGSAGSYGPILFDAISVQIVKVRE